MAWKDWIPPVFYRKASKVNLMIAAWLLGEPVWTPVSYQKLAEEGFERNVWVYRSIMSVAQAASVAPWVLYQEGGSERKEIDQHDLLDLLDCPNPFMSKQEFFEAIVAFAMLDGNAYIQHVGPKIGPPKELWLWRPDRVKVIPDRKNLVKGYRYEVHGQHEDFPANAVSHLTLFSPTYDWYGLSPIQVVARTVDMDNYANVWNTALFQNGARPSGAMVTERDLTDDQYTRLSDEIDQLYKGAKNAGRPMLLEGGLDWKEMSLSPQDMDYIETKKMTRLEIATVFGVPAEVLGIPDAKTYSNYEEARKALYEDAVLPILYKVRDKLNADLVPKFGENLYLDIAKDRIEALQENQEAVWNRAIKAVNSGMIMLNEGRRKMGFEDVEGGNVFFFPKNKRIVGEDADQYAFNDPQDQEDTDPKGKGDEDQKGLQVKAVNLVTEDERRAYFKAFDGRRERFYDSVGEKVADYFKKEMRAVLKGYKDTQEPGAIEAVDRMKPQLQKLLASVYVNVMDHFGSMVFDHLTREIRSAGVVAEVKLFDVFLQAVQRFIAETVANKVVEITETTREAIKRIIDTGIDQALGVWDIADLIEELYLDEIIPNRSVVIARTEVIAASNAGSRHGAIQTGLPLEKEWIATDDERTRHAHNEADGQIRNLNEPYDVGGEQLMFPGDPSGSPWNVIQCRCTEGYHVKD